jgi:hypothetical protein
LIALKDEEMHIPFKKTLFLLLLPITLIVANVSICYANSPPPPTIFVVVAHAPKDLELRIGSEKAQRTDKILESYYTFHLGFTGINSDTLLVTTNDGSFEIALPQLQQYNNAFTLDLVKRTLTRGTSWLRPYEFASITIILTLLIEGVIFFLFGYRKRNSWIVFLATNILTQGFLYVWLNTQFYPLVNSYFFPVLFSLIVGEFLVFISEITVFLILVRERRRLVTFSYVVAANFASLIAGGFLINALI